jgi:hypothetical protein
MGSPFNVKEAVNPWLPRFALTWQNLKRGFLVVVDRLRGRRDWVVLSWGLTDCQQRETSTDPTKKEYVLQTGAVN